jgi:PAS domain S-box-containing protein
VLLVAVATAARFPFEGVLRGEVPFLLYFPAVLAAAWYGGFGAGLLAGLLSALTAQWFWMEPRNAWAHVSLSHALQVGFFVLIAGFMSWLIESLRKTIERLQAARQQIEQTMSSMTDAFVVLDREWRYTYINDRGVEISQRTRDELLGEKLWDVFPADIGTVAYRELSRAMKERVAVHFENYSPSLKGWFQVRAYPTEQGLTLYVADITQEKNIEEAVKKELERQVAEKTRELAERNEALETLANTLAHDLRAPMRAISNFTAVLMEEAGAKLNAQERDYFQRIERAVGQAHALLTNLLEFARLSHAPLPTTVLPLGAIVSKVVEQLSDEIERADGQVKVDEMLPEVIGNQTVLEQAIANLVGNALKFSRRGVAPVVSVSATADNGTVRLCVSDNGTGIPPEQAGKLFTPFQRLTNEKPGTGLGLSIVKKGIERMGGRVGVESQPGEGSKFWISLPRAEGSGSEAKDDGTETDKVG